MQKSGKSQIPKINFILLSNRNLRRKAHDPGLIQNSALQPVSEKFRAVTGFEQLNCSVKPDQKIYNAINAKKKYLNRMPRKE